jgi:hypothetical protein
MIQAGIYDNSNREGEEGDVGARTVVEALFNALAVRASSASAGPLRPFTGSSCSTTGIRSVRFFKGIPKSRSDLLIDRPGLVSLGFARCVWGVKSCKVFSDELTACCVLLNDGLGIEEEPRKAS